MFKRLLIAFAGTLMVLAGAVRAEVDPNYSVVLLTENFPPYNMAINGKNFAQEDNIDGIAVDVVREMFKRAGVKYSLTLRFPGIASTSWRWKNRTTVCSSPRACRSVSNCSSGLARSVLMTG